MICACQCEQLCWSRRCRGIKLQTFDNAVITREVNYSGLFTLQRHSVQHRQGTQSHHDNGRYPVNTTCVTTAEHIEISANTHWFTVYIEEQVEPCQNIPHPAYVRNKLISPKTLRLINCGLWFIKLGEDVSVATVEDSAKMYGTTGDTPPVSEDGPAPRPCKFWFFWLTRSSESNCVWCCVCVAVLGASKKIWFTNKYTKLPAW
jgi:hypothetical protein